MKTSFATLPVAVLFAAAIASHAQLAIVKRLHSFGLPDQMGIEPRAGLILGSDGYLYGTTSGGGRKYYGVVFKVHPSGAGYQVLHHFDLRNSFDGAIPDAALLEGSDGVLYGTTSQGGIFSGGTVFKLKKNGSRFAVLHHFKETSEEGFQPEGPVIEGSDGKLYGTTLRGPAAGEGMIYRMNKDGSEFQILRMFNADGSDGMYPFCALVEGSDGLLYGTASERGSTNVNAAFGTAYKINKDGSGFAVIKSFPHGLTGPGNVQAGLIEGNDGLLYGLSVNGGSADAGTVFKIQKDGQNFATLHSFGSGADATLPFEELIEGQDGLLYGTTANGGDAGLGTVFKIGKNGTGFTILHHFAGLSDGMLPRCKLAQAPSGELFGATQQGGWDGHGTIFAIGTNGLNYRILWEFSFSGGDLRLPQSALVEDSDGALYGAAYAGGILKADKEGTGYTVVRRFDAYSSDPLYLTGGLILGSDGKLYGTSVGGGNQGLGTVYRIDRDGAGFQVLHHFAMDPDGRFPEAGLVEASDGFLYGVTRAPVAGTIFRVAKNGSGYKIIRYLYQYTDGADPQVALIEGSDGFLYGTTPTAGLANSGTIFKCSKDGTNLTVLRPTPSGDMILGSLFEGSDGLLYGTTYRTGADGRGNIFTIKKDGAAYRILHAFTETEHVSSPRNALVEGRDGALYGTLFGDATVNGDAIFKIQKDGSGFMVLHRFTGIEGIQLYGALLKASDGAFYATAYQGGDFNLGAIVRIGHMARVQPQNNTAYVEFTGIPGYSYQLERSANLRDWSFMAADLMPDAGRIEFTDTDPPFPNAFYRVAPIRPP